MLYKTDDPIKWNIIVYSNNNVWGFSDRNVVFIKNDAINNKPKRIDIPVQKSFNSSISASGFESLNHLKDEIFLIGNTNGFTSLNLDKLKTPHNKISINSVHKQELNLPKEQLALNKSTKLEANQNNLFFTFSVPEFTENIDVNYQYRLKGFYNNWNNWTDVSNASYKNLPFGTYTFEVRARIGNIISENIADYSFEIDRPWYLSNLAFVLYSVFSLLLFVLIHAFYKRYYKKQKQKLIAENQLKALLFY